MFTQEQLTAMSPDELRQAITAMQAPRASSRVRANRITVDGVELEDRVRDARLMTRLTAASEHNLQTYAPLRLRAMGIEAKRWACVKASPSPYILAETKDGERTFDIFITSDATGYYLVEHARRAAPAVEPASSPAKSK